MRSIDHIDLRKHIKAIRKIKPICRSKYVAGSGVRGSETGIEMLMAHPEATVQTMRYLCDWKGRNIRVGLAIGAVNDGDVRLTEVGQLCLDQWMRSYPSQTIFMAEFKGVATGNLSEIRLRLVWALNRVPDDSVLMLLAKNSTMYDKIAALIGAVKLKS